MVSAGLGNYLASNRIGTANCNEFETENLLASRFFSKWMWRVLQCHPIPRVRQVEPIETTKLKFRLGMGLVPGGLVWHSTSIIRIQKGSVGCEQFRFYPEQGQRFQCLGPRVSDQCRS